MVSFGNKLLMRSLNTRVGATVKRWGSAFSIWKLRSGIRFLSCRFVSLRFVFYYGGPLLQFVEEVADLLPDFGSAGKAAPVDANQADQLVALVDWEDEVLRRGDPARVSNPVDEQGFDIGLHFLQYRIGVLDVLPGLKREKRLGCAGGAGIKGDHPCIRRAAEKESHADRHHQALPLAVGEMKVGQGEHAAGNALVFRSHPAE